MTFSAAGQICWSGWSS